MLLWLVAALLAGAAGAYVLSPLLSRRSYAASPVGERGLEDLLDQKERAYDAIGELESDLELGKLSQEDYNRLYER